jgi:hypothetical protein
MTIICTAAAVFVEDEAAPAAAAAVVGFVVLETVVTLWTHSVNPQYPRGKEYTQFPMLDHQNLSTVSPILYFSPCR